MEDIKTSCRNSNSVVISARMSTPIGTLELTSCGGGWHSIKLPNQEDFENTEFSTADFKCNVKYLIHADLDNSTKDAKLHLDHLIGWIQSYFTDNSTNENKVQFSDFCFADDRTEFELSVWKTLFETVGLGETTTYGKLAAAINNPKAVRAVGSALKKNPFPLIIPCHRVLKSDGSIGSFSGGKLNNCKKFLINFEKEKQGITTTKINI